MKKSIFKSNLFYFTLGAIIFGSITSVVAYNYSAKDIEYKPNESNWNVNTVEEAINDLYNKKCNANNEFDNKEYTTNGISIYSSRVNIISGGYYIDNNNVYVNIEFITNKTFPSDDWNLILSGLPYNSNIIPVMDESKKYTFVLYPESNQYSKFAWNPGAYGGINLPSDTIVKIKFKYGISQ